MSRPVPRTLADAKSTIANIWDGWRDIERKNLPLAAAGIAYYLLLAIFPALTLLSAVLSYVPVQHGLQEAISVLGFVIPPQVMALIKDMLARITPHRGALLSFGLITTLWLASVAFKGLILGLDMVYGSKNQRPLWVSRIIAFALTIAVGFLLLIGVILSSIGPSVWAHLSRLTPLESQWWRVAPYAKWVVSALILFAAIELLYVLGPSVPVSKRRTFPGATCATLVWLAMSWGLGYYFQYFGEIKLNRSFGFLAVPALFMSWLYCSAAAVLFGAEINARLKPAKNRLRLGGVRLPLKTKISGNRFDFSEENRMTTRGKILVLVSSGHGLPLKDGKVYAGAGYYLNELTVPVRALMKEGYEITFANPKGNAPQLDLHSAVPDFFGGDEGKLNDYMRFRDSLTGLEKPSRISDVIASGLDQYDAVFVPGGHGPMEDLLDDPHAGTVMRHFHETSKPTAVLCHGPISLLSALPNSKEFVAALAAGDAAGAQAKAKGWIYAGYKMTIFSTAEEQQREPLEIHGKVLFYPDVALRTAGGDVSVAAPWKSYVLQDRELISGQNPFSDEALLKLLLPALNRGRAAAA